jgi:mRNA interferase YafQ
MYTVYHTKTYLKSLEKLTKNNKVKIAELDFVIDELSKKRSLPPKYKDHQLKGDSKEFRECHVHNDILLLYQYIDNKLILVAANIGTHASLFG